MSEVNEEQIMEDDPGYDRSRQRINLMMHPLGGVLLDVTDAHGRNAAIQLDQGMLGQIVLTLITMNVILTQQEQAARAMAEANLPKDLWTPNG